MDPGVFFFLFRCVPFVNNHIRALRYVPKVHLNILKTFHTGHISGSTLTLVLLNPDIPFFANSVDPDQLASEEAN